MRTSSYLGENFEVQQTGMSTHVLPDASEELGVVDWLIISGCRGGSAW